MIKRIVVLMVLLGCLGGCEQPQPAVQKFFEGDRVKLRADPRYTNGMIVRVWCPPSECYYNVRFGLYEVNGLRDFELERVK
jgi:hypothetical protein